MSGGFFDYKQWEISSIAAKLEQLIIDNDSDELTEYGSPRGHHYSPATVDEMKKGMLLLTQAEIYAHRIDRLVSGDDDETSFHSRLSEDLATINNAK